MKHELLGIIEVSETIVHREYLADRSTNPHEFMSSKSQNMLDRDKSSAGKNVNNMHWNIWMFVERLLNNTIDDKEEANEFNSSMT